MFERFLELFFVKETAPQNRTRAAEEEKRLAERPPRCAGQAEENAVLRLYRAEREARAAREKTAGRTEENFSREKFLRPSAPAFVPAEERAQNVRAGFADGAPAEISWYFAGARGFNVDERARANGRR